MPLGLCNAPATFQRLLNIILAGLTNCSAYLDDEVIYSSIWEEYVEMLHRIFSHLENASLPLNLAKCEFGLATITYLGKQVGQGKVLPLEAKVIAMLNFSTLTTRRDLCKFLGMVGYYRNFCSNFSSVACHKFGESKCKVNLEPRMPAYF